MAALANGGELGRVRVLSEAGRDRATEGAKKDAFLEKISPAGENVQGGWGRNPAKNRTYQYGWGGAVREPPRTISFHPPYGPHETCIVKHRACFFSIGHRAAH